MRVTTIRSTAVTLALPLTLLLGCAGEAPAVKQDEGAGSGPRYRPGQMPLNFGDEQEKDVNVQFEAGYLDQSDIDEVMERHTPDLIACYDHAGQARRYASGKVKLRFMVGKTGEVTEVRVIGNDLGNYATERCLVVEGRKLRFRPPGGGKRADFEYAIEFRSTGELHVIDAGHGVYGRDVGALSPSLASCGRPSEDEVVATAYVQPGGSIGSVGLASPGRLDIMAAICVVEQIRKWRLPVEGSHVVRTSFPVALRSAEAEVTSPPPGAKRRPARRRLR
jgi:hypothetical protein